MSVKPWHIKHAYRVRQQYTPSSRGCICLGRRKTSMFLGERYQVQEPIGRGGMATVYRGLDIRMDRAVAIKVLRDVYSTDPKFVTRFQRLARTMTSLQHPNLVQVYDD